MTTELSSPVEPKGRREREDAERRELVLQVAERLFAIKGFHQTSVHDIAREAEFGIGTLYKYFKDKLTLFQELLDSRMQAHLAEVEGALASTGTPVEILDRFISAQLESMHARQAFFGVCYTYCHPQSPSEQLVDVDIAQTRERQLDVIGRLRAVVRRGIDEGHLAAVDPDYIAGMIIGGLISMYYVARMRFEDEWDLEEMKSSYKKVLFGRVLLKDPDTTEVTS